MITSKNWKFFKETGNNETFEVSSKRLSSSIKVKKDMIERLTKEVKEQQSYLKEV